MQGGRQKRLSVLGKGAIMRSCTYLGRLRMRLQCKAPATGSLMVAKRMTNYKLLCLNGLYPANLPLIVVSRI